MKQMNMSITVITGGRHNPTLAVELNNEASCVFAMEFINLFGNLVKTDEGIVAQGNTYQQKTPEMMDDLRKFIQGHGNRKELWDFYNILNDLKNGEYFAIVTRPLTDEEYEAIKNEVLRHNIPDYDKLEQFKDQYFGDLMKNYRILHYEQEKRQVRIGEPDKSKRKCRICGEMIPVVSYNKDAHTISEGLGNKTIITNDECDRCNEELGREIEQDLMVYLSPFRTFYSIIGKHGKSKIKDESFAFYENAPREIKIDLFEKEDPELKHWQFSQDGDNFKVTFTHPQMINVQDVYRAVVKYAIGVMEEAELPHFKETIEWVRKHKSSNNLSRLCFFLDTEPKSDNKPCVTVFLRKNDDKTLPYSFVQLQVSGVVIFAVIPFCDQDDRTFADNEDWKRLIDILKIYKEMPFLKMVVPNKDSEERITYNFEMKKRAEDA